MSADTVIDSYDTLSQSWSRCNSFLGQKKHETNDLITDLPKGIGKLSLFPERNEPGGDLSEDTSAKKIADLRHANRQDYIYFRPI